jgi:hypothetical protein
VPAAAACPGAGKILPRARQALAYIQTLQQLFTDKSSECIPFDQPDFVVDAIREVYSQSR